MTSAPIALFTFKRPAHTLRALQSLAQNAGFESSPLHIFCDGPRRPEDEESVNATRDAVRGWQHPNKVVHEAAKNRGLAASIVDGVTRLCADHGRVIVVEDDLTVAPVFLRFMNEALDRYADEPSVMQVSGHQFPVVIDDARSDAVFLPFATSWGWATWRRAWKEFDPKMTHFGRLAADRALRKKFDLGNSYPYYAMLKRQKAGKIDSWAVRWYLSIFIRDGLVLYPRRSLVNNFGFDGSGTHSADRGEQIAGELPTSPLSSSAGPPVVDQEAMAAISKHLRTERGSIKLVVDQCQRVLDRMPGAPSPF